MRLSQALIQRADLQERLNQLGRRLVRSARIYEGEQVPENPETLLTELDQLTQHLSVLISKINITNSITPFDDSRVLTDALAERDVLTRKRLILSTFIETASGENTSRYRQTTIKSFSTVDISEIQKTIDDISRQYRELDDRIQEINWTTELIE